MYVLESWMNIDTAIIYHSVPAMTLKQAFKVGVSLDVILCIHVDNWVHISIYIHVSDNAKLVSLRRIKLYPKLIKKLLTPI